MFDVATQTMNKRKMALDNETKGRGRTDSRIEVKFIILKVLMNRDLKKHGILWYIDTGGRTRYAQEPSNKLPVLVASNVQQETATDINIPDRLIYAPRHAMSYFARQEAAVSHIFFARLSISTSPITIGSDTRNSTHTAIAISNLK
jgi:hypothetical protein